MGRWNRSPFRRPGAEEDAEKPEAGMAAARQDEHPRSIPEDRNEGNLNPDPNVECHECITGTHAHPHPHPHAHAHAPSGEPESDDGAGNISPREPEDWVYGQDDVDGLEMETEHKKKRPES